MSFQSRGGIPRARRYAAIDTTGQQIRFDALSMNVCLEPTGAALRVFFSQEDFDNDLNYWEIADGELFDKPIEDRCIWVKAAAGAAAVQMLVLHRKG